MARKALALLPVLVFGGALIIIHAATAQQSTPSFGVPTATPLPTLPTVQPDQPAEPQPEASSPAGRVFCDQNVSVRVANPASVPQPYRPFIGIFSDADWTPQTCAALIVERVTGDGTATITYVFGPIASGGKTPGGALHGTGIIKDGALLFQNTDGSQYAFQPFYSDLKGKWTTPQGQTYEAVFKRSF